MADPHHPPGPAADYSKDYAKDADSPGTLLAVYAAVVLLFLTTLGVSVWGKLGPYTLFAQLAIATVQAGLVAYYFMHLRQGDRVVTLTALASVFWTMILFVLFLSDYMTRHRVVYW